MTEKRAFLACVPCIVAGSHTIDHRCHKRGKMPCASCQGKQECTQIPPEFEKEKNDVLQMQKEYDEGLNQFVKDNCRAEFNELMVPLKKRLEKWFAEELKQRQELAKQREEEEMRRQAEAEKAAEEERKAEEERMLKERMDFLHEYLVGQKMLEDKTPPQRIAITTQPLSVKVENIESLLERLVQSQEAMAAAMQRHADAAIQNSESWAKWFELEDKKRKRGDVEEDCNDEKCGQIDEDRNAGGDKMDMQE
ncbi:hypothetical protein AAP_00787 [Ascosphaera apis ARSEF 7405]|uniref:Uncharacterized protein n=1 Tax=Ascosphaera apis ARSEF 7405 TaxID=392613 RepID=A0A168CY14_9EURO|nr:hypothetical protein AAP_00787 [Ascosphaera apis ARSEF 7405]